MTADPLSALSQAVEAALTGGPAVIPPAWQPTGHLPPDVALAVASSGSTGHPKLVLLSAAAITASARASAQRLGGTGSWLLALPTNHVAGLNVVARAVLAGTALTALRGPFTAQAFNLAARAMPPGPRFVSLVPTQLQRLLPDPAAVAELGGFAAILLGGAPVPANTQAQTRQLGLPVVQTYGMAETCGGCVYDGVPLDGVQLRLGAGLAGRIELSGSTLALGYLDQAATAAAFVNQAGQRWYLSSDQGHLDTHGHLTVLGRLDHIIQTGGHKVAPEAVEHRLEAHPAVTQVVVTGLPDPQWGQVVTALVVGPNPPTLDQLRTWLEDNSSATDQAEPTRERLPRALGIVDQLPYLAPGKVDRTAAATLARRLDNAGQIDRLR